MLNDSTLTRRNTGRNELQVRSLFDSPELAALLGDCGIHRAEPVDLEWERPAGLGTCTERTRELTEDDLQPVQLEHALDSVATMSMSTHRPLERARRYSIRDLVAVR